MNMSTLEAEGRMEESVVLNAIPHQTSRTYQQLLISKEITEAKIDRERVKEIIKILLGHDLIVYYFNSVGEPCYMRCVTRKPSA